MKNFAHLYSLSAVRHVLVADRVEDLMPVTIAFDPHKCVPSGSPGLIKKESGRKDSYGNHLIPVLFPFPTRTGAPAGTYIDLRQENLYPMPQKNLITNHKIKEIQQFDLSHVYRVGEYVADNAAITFVMSDLAAASEFWKIIPTLCSYYKYSVLFQHKGGSPHRSSLNYTFIPFVSFIDITYCIPIFNARKVDGMGVHCGFMYKTEKGVYNCIDTLSFVLSNHQTNLLYLDGTKIAEPCDISTDILEYMQRFIIDEISYVESKQKKIKPRKDLVEKNKPKKDIMAKFSTGNWTTTTTF